MTTLKLVRDKASISESLITFNQEAPLHYERAKRLMRQTSYWVYYPKMQMFGPGKFVGFKGMNFTHYGNAIKGNFWGDPFDGHRTRRAIEAVLGPFSHSDSLAAQLIQWANWLLGVGVLDNLKESKWQFVSLI